MVLQRHSTSTATKSLSAKYLVLLVFLGGCAERITSGYTPYTVEIKDQALFNNDLQACRNYALQYLRDQGGLKPSEMAQEGATEGLNKMGYVVVSPLAPVLGALGGASGEAMTQLGLNSVKGKKIVASCMKSKGDKSGNYLTIDPEG